MRTSSIVRVALLGAALSTGCNALLGLEVGDLAGAGGGSATGGGTASGAGGFVSSSSGVGGKGGTGGIAGTGGVGGVLTCGPEEKACGGACVKVTDPAFGCGPQGCSPCSLAHATVACANGLCSIGGCAKGFVDCDGEAKTGCEVEIGVDPLNCGKCGVACPVPANASSACFDGNCAIGACFAGFKDCDGKVEDGCETSVDADPKNCGGCAASCSPVKEICQGGQCQMNPCGLFGDCDAVPGCETDLSTSLQNCGFCGNACAALDACHDVGSCSFGVCSNPVKVNGAACDDGDQCTAGDVCTAGVCGGAAILCVALDQCHDVGACKGGACAAPPKADGAMCDDGDPCTKGDSCVFGLCTGFPAVCPAMDACHVPGTCHPASGTCDNPVKLCAPYICNPSLAGGCVVGCGSDADCVAGAAHCNKSGACVPNIVSGGSCSDAVDCMVPGCLACAGAVPCPSGADNCP